MAEPQPPVFGKNSLKDYKRISKAEEGRIARNAAHPSGVDTSRPPRRLPESQRPHLRFPEPKVREVDGRRFTTVAQGAHLYSGPTGEANRIWVGDLEDLAAEFEYIKRWPHPALEDAMPSIELGVEKPIRLRSPDGEMVEYKDGVLYGDRRGTIWDGMPEPIRK